MAVRTASDVAELETEVILLRSENEATRRRVAVLEAENGGLKIENAKLDQRARDEMRKATEMETIINQTSMGLVSALNAYKRNRQIATEMRRAQQADELAAETGDAPAFLTRGTDRTRPRDHDGFQTDGHDTMNREDDTEGVSREDIERDRADRLRGAAERIAPPSPPVRPAIAPLRPTPRPAIPDQTMADRDPRMPAMGDYRPTTPPRSRAEFDADQENLREIAGRMGA